MSISKTAYDTTACRGFITAKITDGLARADIQGLLQYREGSQYCEVQGGHLVDEIVPAFAHPILFVGRDNIEKLAIDVRGLGKYDGMQQRYVLRDVTSYEGLGIRATLNGVWLEPTGPDRLRTISMLPLSLYANWIGEVVAKRLALEPMDQFTLSVLAAIFYLNQFWDSEKSANPTKIEKTYLVSAITRGLGFKADSVYDIVEAHAGLTSMDDFCQAARDYTQSTRLRDLNPATLIGMIGGYWYGANGREVIAAALEHPPTWISLLWQAMADRGYRNAGLTKILERPTYKRQSSQFGLAVASLVKSA